MTSTLDCGCLSKALVLLCLFLNLGSAMELLKSNIVEKQENYHVYKAGFQMNMKALANDTWEEESGENLLQKNVIGDMDVGDYSKKESANAAFLTRYRYMIDSKQDEWDGYIANGESIHKLTYPRKDSQAHLSNEMYYYGLLYVNMPMIYIMSIYKLNGYHTINSLLKGSSNFREYLLDPRNRMQFYLDLATMWNTLTEAGKKICVPAPDEISVNIIGEGPYDYAPMFRYPEMSVGLAELCHDFNPLYSTQSVIMGIVETFEAYQKSAEVFSLGRVIFYIEAILGILRSEKDSEGNKLAEKMVDFEKKIKAERNKENYGNENLEAAKAYFSKELLLIVKNKPFLDESETEKNDQITQVFEAFYAELETTIRENNFTYPRPAFSTLVSSFTNYLNTLEEAMGDRRRRNVLLL